MRNCPHCKRELYIINGKEIGRNLSFCDNPECAFYGIKRLISLEGDSK